LRVPNHPESEIEVDDATGTIRGMKGLLGQSSLPQGNGLLVKSKQVHTLGMAFTIDVIYLGPDFSILKIKTLPPGRLGPLVLRAKWVLELAGGEASRLGLRKGLALERIA
ncbi:MAG: DUF192 domain-containing protein, partial [Actinomycetota bacterium]